MKCKSCDKNLYFFRLYDSHICANCNKWESDKCGEDDCDFCAIRPDKPIKESIHPIIKDAYLRYTEEDNGLLIEHYFVLAEKELDSILKLNEKDYS